MITFIKNCWSAALQWQAEPVFRFGTRKGDKPRSNRSCGRYGTANTGFQRFPCMTISRSGSEATQRWVLRDIAYIRNTTICRSFGDAPIGYISDDTLSKYFPKESIIITAIQQCRRVSTATDDSLLRTRLTKNIPVTMNMKRNYPKIAKSRKDNKNQPFHPFQVFKSNVLSDLYFKHNLKNWNGLDYAR